MFQRYLIILLVLSTFGYGSAWAFDGHSDEAGGHSNDHSQEFLLDDQHENHDDHQKSGCDHHCHAGAHMLGLIAHLAGLSATDFTSDRHVYVFNLHSYQGNPPYHPPLS